MKKVERTGSVRVDLLGGTLDIWPINLVLENVMTLNVATSLKAKVILEETDRDGVEIVSLDYDSTNFFDSSDFTEKNFRGDHFGPLSFVCQIILLFKAHKNLKVTLESGSPPGAGLGGSSTMGVTLFSALCEFTEKNLDRHEAITQVQAIESRILDAGPAGYQDYYPALYGGVLALHAKVTGVEVEQLYTETLKKALENHITLVYSGETRNSGINNWEVYKGFFDKVPAAREGLEKIAGLTLAGYQALKHGDIDQFIASIAEEGQVRSELFPRILSPSMKELMVELPKKLPHLGINVCGAGGGGCFMLLHKPEDREIISAYIDSQTKMKVLPFNIDTPLC